MADTLKISLPPGTDFALDPEILSYDFAEADKQLQRMLDISLFDSIEDITSHLSFTGETEETEPLKQFLLDVWQTWKDLQNGSYQEGLFNPLHDVERRVFTEFSQRITDCSEPMQRLTMDYIGTIQIVTLRDIYREAPDKENEQGIADRASNYYFSDSELSTVFYFNTLLAKNLSIQLVNKIYTRYKEYIDAPEDRAGKPTRRKKLSQIQEELRSGLLHEPFLPMLNGALVNDLMPFTLKAAQKNPRNNTAVYVTKNGHKISIENFDKIQGTLSTSAKKIMHTSLMFLKDANFFRSSKSEIIPSIEIPLIEYGEANGYHVKPEVKATPEEQEAENKKVTENIKYLTKEIRRDLRDISSMVWSGEEKQGKNRGEYTDLRIISSHSIRNGRIRVNFDVLAAAYLNTAYIMQYPTALLKIDNRRPNAYAIGYKIALHNSNDNNFRRGTNNTLSVESLLQAAPVIPTMEELQSKNRRDWKVKIKAVLEDALDENVACGFLQKWEYRDTASGKSISASAAENLSWLQYSCLMIDFIVIDPPDQTERRANKEKALLALTQHTQETQQKHDNTETEQPPKRRRERPPKAKNERKKGGVIEVQKGGDRGTKGE